MTQETSFLWSIFFLQKLEANRSKKPKPQQWLTRTKKAAHRNVPVKQVVLSPVCGLWGMGSNEAANTERPQPVISNNLFTTITHNQHQPSRLPQHCCNCLYFKHVGLSAAVLHLSATFAVLQSGASHLEVAFLSVRYRRCRLRCSLPCGAAPSALPFILSCQCQQDVYWLYFIHSRCNCTNSNADTVVGCEFWSSAL